MSGASFAAVDRGIPRRLSACKSDRHYDGSLIRHLNERGIDVLLDGKVQAEVASWDADEGTITRRRRRADGSLVLKEGVPTFETLRGDVEVRWQKGPAA